MDINKLVNETTDKIIAEKLPLIVEEKVTSMITGVLDNIFRTYSETGKAIEKKIEEALQVNLGKFDLVDYAGLVAQLVNSQLIKEINMEPINNLIRNTIGIVNAEKMKISEVVGWFTSYAQEDDTTDSEGEISLYIEKDDERSWTVIHLHSEADKSKEECQVSLSISGNDNKIFHVSCGSYWWKGLQSVDPLKLSQLDNLSHKVFRLYAAGVEIEMDETDEDSLKYWERY